MWSLIVAIVVGFIAGLIARAIHPGNDKAGFFITALLGIAGSFIGYFWWTLSSDCMVKTLQQVLLLR